MKAIILSVLTILIMASFVSGEINDYKVRWKFEETDKLIDYASGKYNGTTIGSVTLTEGVDGNAYYTAHSTWDTMVEDFQNSDELMGWCEGTWSVWVNVSYLNTSITEDELLILRYDDAGYGNDTILGFARNTNKLYVSWQSQADSTEYELITDFDITNHYNEWHMYTFTWNSSGRYIYIDGNLNKSDTRKICVGSSGRPIRIGRAQDANYSADEFLIYNRSLSPAEVAYLYSSSAAPSVIITLDAPADNTIFSDVSINFTASGETNFYNFTNITFYVWNSSGIFNETFVDVIDNNTFQETKIIDSFKLGNYEWNVLACYRNSSYSNCTFASTNNSFFVGASVDAESYNNETYETTLENFGANITLLEDTILYDVGLIYNGIEYSADYSAIDSDSYHLNSSFYVPSVSSDTNFSWHWILYYDVDGNIITQNLTAHSQLVKKIPSISVGTSCPTGFFPAINYSFADAENRTALNADVDYNFKFGIGNLTGYVVHGEKTNISNLYVCVNQTIDNYKLGYGEIQYEEGGYSARRYYMFEGQELSNSTTANHTLYLLPSSKSTSFIIEVKNTYLNPYVEKYVSLLRWYPELNEYKIVEMGRTDEEGQVVMKVHTEDVDYRIGVYELNGSLIKLASPVRMACLVTPCTYSLKIVHGEINYFYEYDIEGNLSFDNANKRFIWIWNDPSQITSSMRLLVEKDMGYQSLVICNVSASGYTGVLTCNIGNETGRIRARVFKSASPEVIFAELVKTFRTAINSTFGLFTGFLTTLITALIGIFSPIAAIIMLMIGLIISVIFGTISLEVFFGLGAVAGIIIHFIKKSGELK